MADFPERYMTELRVDNSIDDNSVKINACKVQVYIFAR